MHGGDIYRNKVHMDFSVNVNPLGIPEEVMKALERSVRKAEAYPDPDCEELKQAIAEHFGLKPEQVVCGNGASELLLAICRWKKPGKALLPAPGFSGYRKVLQTVKCGWKEYPLPEKQDFTLTDETLTSFLEVLQKGNYDILFLTNPSNPTGALLKKEMLLKIARFCEKNKILLILDECFVELTKAPAEYSFVSELERFRHVCILRAFTKSFAIPGIRLGYVLCKDPKDAKAIEKELPEWNVSLPAQMAGVTAMKETKYLEKSREVIRTERNWLKRRLEELGTKVYPSKTNFLLFHTEQTDLYERLLEQGILIRDCEDYVGLGKGYYRIAVKQHADNEELIQKMSNIMDKEIDI